MADSGDGERLTAFQRLSRRRMYRIARKKRDEPLSSEDWAAYFEMGAHTSVRAFMWTLRALPRSPRCVFCGAPFEGFGSRLVRPLGYRPSRKNPYMCVTCVELSPPGGTTMDTGVLFADVRGFTRLAEEATPADTSALLRRFYSCAESVFFPGALIDKLMGDAVMALYLPIYGRPEHPGQLMLDHGRQFLRAVGYGTEEGPFLEVGVGVDFGDAFVGNIGERALYDFTAIGDVVNTASRLQGTAEGGEIVVSSRVADGLKEPLGEAIKVNLKGKTQAVEAFRIRIGGET